MFENRQKTEASTSSEPIELGDNTFLVDAVLIGELLHIPASSVPSLMHEGQITGACERGIDEHEGEFRLTFFYRNRRARLSIDPAGHLLRRSAIDFGDRLIPGAQHRAAG